MNNIIQFPAKQNYTYSNLSKLFAICTSAEACDFYLDILEQSADRLTGSELLTLRRIGRQKLRKLSDQTTQESQISASLGHYGTHWYINTDLDIRGRGIRFIESTGNKNRYIVTARAFEKLEKQYSIAIKDQLD
jgi:hypothetical protein